MSSAKLIGQLARMTSERDTDLLEWHLLRTMQEVLAFDEVGLLRTNPDDGSPRLSIYPGHDRRETIDAKAAGNRFETAPFGASEEHMDAIFGAVQADRVVCIPDRLGFTTVYPLRGKEATFGHLLLRANARASPPRSKSIEDTLRVFYNYYALLEENQTDKLTGLLNRKTFDERIGKLLSTVAACAGDGIDNDRRRAMPAVEARFWFAVVDIDHFKRINDGYGHLFGDEVLLLLAQLMRRSFRRSDLLFRFGGEEFVIVIDTSDEDGARNAFDKFRSLVAGYRFPQVGQVTISMGATEIDGRCLPSDLVGRADQALYHAKHCGRNRLFFYEDLVTRGEIAPPAQQGSVEMF